MGWFSLKKMVIVILLLVILFISSNFDTCNARRGKHWRRVRGDDETSTLWAKKKSRGKNGWSISYHHIRSKSRSWKKRSPSTSISPPPPPTTKAPIPTFNPSPKPSPPPTTKAPTPTFNPSPKPSPPPTTKAPAPTSNPSPKPSSPPPPTPKAPTPTSNPSPKPSPLPPTKAPTPTSIPSPKPSPPPTKTPTPTSIPSPKPSPSPTTKAPTPTSNPSPKPSPSPTTKAPTPTSNRSSKPSPPPPPPTTKAPTPTSNPSPKPSPPPPLTKAPTPTSNPSPKPSPPPPLTKSPTPTSSSSPKPSPHSPPTKVPTPTSSPSQKPSLKPSPPPSPKTSTTPTFPQPGVHSKNLNVLDFGARGNGVLDDTKAFQAAWAVACKVEGSTIVVPSDHVFLVGPISFSGPYCQTNIVFQLDGTIIAPTNTAAWGSGTLQWLEFTKLKSITIRGKGIIDGRGSGWWSSRQFEFEPINNELAGAMPHIKPTALRFYGSYNVTVTGIAIQNSPQCHLKFDNCVGVEVFNMTISSPADSLNTDGIHLQNSKDVSIHHNQLGCGDDCISIQTGCSNVNIHHVNCGPGHGISIGGLGRDNTKACVSNITVQNVQLQGTMTGVRIKTWQGGSGVVQNIRFSNIQVKEVQTPIVIDQFYCDRDTCKNQSAAVSLSGISYENIKGTFTVKPVHLACSDSSPCSDITLNEIELQPLPQHYHMYDVFCWQTYGLLRSQIVPPIECLQTGKPAKNLIESDPDSC